MHESTDSTAEAPRRSLDFRKDAVTLTSAMLSIADFRKTDPEAIIEATDMFYRAAWSMMYRLHGEQITRNPETLEALAEQDENEANEVEETQTGHDLSTRQ